MTQLVFVHGVATREDPGYAQAVANRDRLFREVALGNRASHIENALWGDVAQRWAWDQASLPLKANLEDVLSFSLAEGLGDAPADGNTHVLASMASHDPGAAIDTLFAGMVALAAEEGRPLTQEEVADFAAAMRHFEAHEGGIEAIDAPDDETFVEAVREMLESPAAFGFVDRLKDAADWVAGKARNLLSTGLTDAFRDDLNPVIARFMGDIFVYLKPGPQREAIQARVREKLEQARILADASNEALVVIGHSMGGIILYDMLSRPAEAGLPADFRVDVLVTVGSQVGVFEEFKLYEASDINIPRDGQDRVPRLANVDHWINVFDPVDLLSFRCQPIFEGVVDYQFSSSTGLASAHTAYFLRPRFFARLKARLDETGAL